MKRVALYPGSFNPWHGGHHDIYIKALQVFDEVIVAVGVNPEKSNHFNVDCVPNHFKYRTFTGLLVDFIADLKTEGINVVAIVRGLRNGDDLQYEMNQQYWNEDLGLEIPVVYFICDRKLAHISSSTIRVLEQFDVRQD